MFTTSSLSTRSFPFFHRRGETLHIKAKVLIITMLTARDFVLKCVRFPIPGKVYIIYAFHHPEVWSLTVCETHCQ